MLPWYNEPNNSCLWDDRTIRRLIADGKLAARLVGTDNDESFFSKSSQLGGELSSSSYLHECPICFLYYTQVNVATCCAASICTECYLQVHPPKEKNVTCPFCNNSNFDVRIAKQLDEEYVLQREEDEQKLIESTIRSRSGLITVSSRTNTIPEKETPEGSVDSVTVADSSLDRSVHDDEFGSTLAKRLRARSESLSVRDLNHNSIMTLSADERRQLELEMKDQKSHPLVRMLELEAEETCHRHELEHSERVSRNRFLLRSSLSRRLIQPSQNSSSATQDRNGNDSSTTVSREGSRNDGLSMLETALLIAMEERSLRDRAINSGLMNIDDSDSSYADALALLQELLSRRQQLRERPTTGSRANQRRLGLEAQLEAATNMLLSILPEEDQIAMAMAMSLGEVNTAQDDISTSQEGIENDETHLNSTEVVSEIPATVPSSNVSSATPETVAEVITSPLIETGAAADSSAYSFPSNHISTTSLSSGGREQE